MFIVLITLSCCGALKCLIVSVIGWHLSHSRHQTCAITNDAHGNDLAPAINPKCQHCPFHQPLRQVLTSTFSWESRDNARKSPRPRKRSEAPLKRRSLRAVPRERGGEGERERGLINNNSVLGSCFSPDSSLCRGRGIGEVMSLSFMGGGGNPTKPKRISDKAVGGFRLSPQPDRHVVPVSGSNGRLVTLWDILTTKAS